MADKTDRRCFLARGVAGAVGIGAAYGSVEENILRAATASGVAQPAVSKTERPKTDIPPGSLALREDRQGVDQPATDGWQLDWWLGP